MTRIFIRVSTRLVRLPFRGTYLHNFQHGYPHNKKKYWVMFHVLFKIYKIILENKINNSMVLSDFRFKIIKKCSFKKIPIAAAKY